MSHSLKRWYFSSSLAPIWHNQFYALFEHSNHSTPDRQYHCIQREIASATPAMPFASCPTRCQGWSQSNHVQCGCACRACFSTGLLDSIERISVTIHYLRRSFTYDYKAHDNCLLYQKDDSFSPRTGFIQHLITDFGDRSPDVNRSTWTYSRSFWFKHLGRWWIQSIKR